VTQPARGAAPKTGGAGKPAGRRKPRAAADTPPETPAATATAEPAGDGAGRVTTVPRWGQFGQAQTPLKVLARLHAYPPRHNAGAEWMTHSLLRALVARGHAVEVWLSRYSPDREPYDLDGVQVVPFAAGLDFGAAVSSADAMVSYLENVPAAGALARQAGTPFVVICHNTQPVTFRNVGRASAALAVYNSLHMQADAEAYFCEYTAALRPARTLVVRPPVLPEDYATTPGDSVTLINLNREKGGDLFWWLAERLPRLSFLGVKGSYGHQVDRPGGLPNVEVLDHVPGNRMRDEVYARTRVLLVPSHTESWGRVAVEAMASGIPVIASPAVGLVESVAGAGVFAEHTDTEAWVAALKQIDDPAVWAQASQCALARSKELDPAADLAAWCDAIETLR
jgi:glycosyltransferase involved in cell wall biosynthesis